MPIADSRLERLQIRKLLQCVNNKDIDQIKKLIEHGVPNLINYNDPDNGITAVISAVKSDDVCTIEFLLLNGACIDIVDFDGKTALMTAAELGNVDIFKKLLDKGANRNANDFNERTALFYCISPTDAHLKCLGLLLDKSMLINKQDRDGETALHVACKRSIENEKFILELLNNGANPNIYSKNGKTAFLEACGTGSSTSVAAALRAGADLNSCDKDKQSGAHEAAKNGHLKVLFVLSAFGFNFNALDNDGNNPLHMAAKVDEMCCKFLGQRGCDAKVKNANGKLPRNIAVDEGKKLCAKELRKLERVTSKTIKNAESWAIRLYDWSIVFANDLRERFIEISHRLSSALEEQKETNSSVSRDKTLLTLHEKNADGCIDWEEFLTGKKYLNKNYLVSAFEKKKGKKKKRKGGKGSKRRKIPMDICTLPSEAIYRRADGGPSIMYIPKEIHPIDLNRFDADHPPVHPLQDDSVWYLDTPRRQYISFHSAALHNDMDSIRLALSEGYDIDTRDKFYKTPLMVAAHHGNLDTAIELIKLGANVNARDNFRWTPLHHAAHSGMIDMVELLINNGALIEAKALNGATPLFRAIECSRLNLVDYFLSKGSKLFVETRKGENPYVVALNWSDPRVIEHVHDKWELAQEAADKQKKQGSAKRKRPTTAGSTSSSKRSVSPIRKFTPPNNLPGSYSNLIQKHFDLSYLIKHTYSLEKTINRQDIRICPRYPWLPKLNREERLAKLAEARERYGWDFGLPNVPSHLFDKHLMNRFQEIEVNSGEQ
ncbi:putative ankyrin repeat domain protein [Schistosoma mansoni]|uniref:putative ankyrin repeat domain protein n=1 Tax=Schistosoma mansoni TaxID=6183 RepID=UPI0001A631E0|nr:putative ankyrin repeat domain protein [Schistosoma mansoni]|eukprot:XP_018649899.1 putative ankyrin repeat domain protein [Schistosoma mansoni]